VCKCACSCRGQRPDHRQAVNILPMTAIFATQPHLILRFVDHSRSLPGKQTASNREPSKCCRQVKHFIPHIVRGCTHVIFSVNTELWPCRPSSQSSSDDGHGGGNTPLRLRVHTVYITLSRLSTNRDQTESRSEPFRRVLHQFFSAHLRPRLSALGACRM
jgi:hypothetical protein